MYICVRKACLPARPLLPLCWSSGGRVETESWSSGGRGGGQPDGERGGAQAQIKPWGPGLGRTPHCYKYAGRLEVRVWWLRLETGDHRYYCSSSGGLPQGILLFLLHTLTITFLPLLLLPSILVIGAPGGRDASRGRRPQAGLQGCPVPTQEEQPEESLRGGCRCPGYVCRLVRALVQRQEMIASSRPGLRSARCCLQEVHAQASLIEIYRLCPRTLSAGSRFYRELQWFFSKIFL